MLRYALARLGALPLVLAVVYLSAVLLVVAAPGDGLETSDRPLPPEVRAQKRLACDFDRREVREVVRQTESGPLRETVETIEPVPAWERYLWIWPRRLFWDGNLPALQYDDWTVVDILRTALPISLQLGLLAFCLAVAIGVIAGTLSATRRDTWTDHGVMLLTLLGISLPSFVVGTLLLLSFGVWLRWTPVGGWGLASQTALPALTLALPFAAYIARLTRSSLLDAFSEDYIRTARAKGLCEARVLLDHALPNALLPVLSYLGPAAAAIFTGSFVVERIFRIPGMGTHVVESIRNRDHSMILATVLVYALFLSIFNLLVDLAYGAIDPRIRVGARRS